MIRIVKNPKKDLKKWAIDLVVSNMKIYNKTPLLRHTKSRSINNPENTFLFSFEDEHSATPNGFLTLRIFSNVLYIYEIHVESTARNRGIGSSLLGSVKDAYKDTVSIFVLYVHKTNKKAINFYKANGFSINKEAKCDNKYYEMIFTR